MEQGGSVILSPADVAYLDMKYVDDPQNALGHTLGLDWAKGPTTLDEAYLWEPTAIVPGLDERDILGVEAPIWTETLASISDVEFMAFPRILGVAEIAWSPAPAAGAARDTEAFFGRVATLGERDLDVDVRRVHVLPWCALNALPVRAAGRSARRASSPIQAIGPPVRTIAANPA